MSSDIIIGCLATAVGVLGLATVIAVDVCNSNIHHSNERVRSANQEREWHKKDAEYWKAKGAFLEDALVFLWNQSHGGDHDEAVAVVRHLDPRVPASVQLPPPCPKSAKKKEGK